MLPVCQRRPFSCFFGNITSFAPETLTCSGNSTFFSKVIPVMYPLKFDLCMVIRSCKDLFFYFEYKHECSCFGGLFLSTDNACSVECPEMKPIDGDFCMPFINFSCDYSEICCPAGDKNNCISEDVCFCELFIEIAMTCFNFTDTLTCSGENSTDLSLPWQNV
jgi:hypothetical protein